VRRLTDEEIAELMKPVSDGWPPGSVIYTGPDEPNLRVVRVLETEDERDEDPEWFRVIVVEAAYDCRSSACRPAVLGRTRCGCGKRIHGRGA